MVHEIASDPPRGRVTIPLARRVSQCIKYSKLLLYIGDVRIADQLCPFGWIVSLEERCDGFSFTSLEVIVLSGGDVYKAEERCNIFGVFS